MNSKKLLIGGIFFFAFSVWVWAFKNALADDADKGIVFALKQWSNGSGVYDIFRCGLPLDESAAPQDATNAPIARSKRYIPISQRKGGGTIHPNGTSPTGTNRGGKALSERKVMGGKPVEDGDFPWAVAIYLNQIYVCSGTLISKRHVLTAAHCFTTGLEKCNDDEEGGCCSKSDAFPLKMVIESYQVFLGSVCLQDRHHMDQDCQSKRRQQGFRLANASYFEFYESKCAGNDYALLELTEDVPAEIGNHICMLHLDERILTEDWHANAKPVVAFGWGWDPLDNFDSSQQVGMARLQRLEMPDIWAPESCAKILGSNTFRDDMLCTMEKADADACRGDSGGGLIAQFADFQGQTRWYLMGAVSFGGYCDKLVEGTAQPTAQVYTNVTFHKAVIDKFAGTEDLLLFKNGPIPVVDGGESNGPAEEKQKPQEPPAAKFFGCD